MGGCVSQKSLEHKKEEDDSFFAPNQRLIKEEDFQIHAEAWNLKPSDIQIALRLATKDKLFVSKKPCLIDKMKCFLYCKHVLDSEPIMRNHMLKQIFGNRDASKPFERLYRIVETGETSSQECKKFDLFVQKHPKWGKETSWVLFRDHELLIGKDAYVERTQLSSLCYMHAPTLCQKYLVSMYSNERVGMVDISIFLRRHADSESLRQHILWNVGGHSGEFLRNLLQLPNYEAFEKPDIKSLDIPQLLRKYGPALVSSMEVRSCFYDQSKDVHLGIPTGELLGHHALVLVGYRMEGDEIRYLLQNWWENKAFVEVNAFYLRATGCILSFCVLPQMSIPSTFSTNYSRHVECNALLEACECLPLETRKRFEPFKRN